MNRFFYTTMPSPIGKLLLAGDEQGLKEIRFDPSPIPSTYKKETSCFMEHCAQLKAYFAGELKEFHLKIYPQGAMFQLKVWKELQKIPYGQTISYKEQAQRISSPNACRAVGAANGKNPIPIIIPCHRVIGADGGLTGYAGGLRIKQTLLNIENPNRLL